MTYPKWLQSSVDPDKLSLTIKAVLAGLIPFLAIINSVTGLHIAPEVVQQIADTLGQLITALWAVGSLLGILYGLIRKLKNA